MKKWIITDTHFNHTNIIKYENRPLNFKEIIIENCRNMISNCDELYHLGDVIFSKKGELFDINSKIPGRKFLTLGNHDTEKSTWFKNKGFDVVSSYLIVDNVLLSHIPMDIRPYKTMGIKYNIHGHFHRKSREEFSRCSKGYPFYSDLHFLLSIEEQEYKPILLDEFLTQKLDELKLRLSKKELKKILK